MMKMMTSMNNNNSGIYKIINKTDGKYYVGSSDNLKKRWYIHKYYLYNNKHQNQHLQYAWNKYGKDNFKFKIVENISKNKLLIIEQKYLDIAKIEQNKCYNLCFSSDRKEITDETKKKISKSLKGRIFTEEHKRKIGIAHKGKLISKVTKKKMSLSKLGINHPMFGKHHSNETRLKMSKNNAKFMLGKHPSKKTILKMIKSSHKGMENFMFGRGYLIKGDKHPNYNSNIYKFQNVITNEIFNGTQYNFRQKYNLHQSSVSRLIGGIYNSHKNWILL